MVGSQEKWTAPVEDSGLTDSATQAIGAVTAAFAAKNTTTVDEIVALAARLTRLFTSTDTAVEPGSGVEVNTSVRAPAMGRKKPAMPIENAVSQEKVFCLCCGRGFTMLKRHLKAEHGLSEEEYRSMFELPDDMPLVAPSYSARKAAYAKRVGLGKYDRDQERVAAG